MTSEPEASQPNHLSDHYILVSSKQTLGEAKAEYGKKEGRLDWILLVQGAGSSFLGCTFREVFPWIANSQTSNLPLEKLIEDKESPLRLVTRVEVDSPEYQELTKAESTKPDALIVITWLGEVGGVWLDQPPGKPAPPPPPPDLLTTVNQMGERSFNQFRRFQEWWPIAFSSFIFGLVITFIS